MYKTYPSTSKEIIDICLNIGCNAIELNVASIEETKMLAENMDKISETLKKFEYVSLHSPGIKVIFKKDDDTRRLLNVFQKAYDKFGCKCLIVHPDKVQDWEIFDEFHFNILIENMSDDVPFSAPENLTPIFEKHPNCKMVLDVNHSYKTYKSDRLARELSAVFRDKISEIHLSGYDTFHDSLFQTKQLDIIHSVPSLELPIIIESGCNTVEDMKTEYKYIKDNIRKNG